METRNKDAWFGIRQQFSYLCGDHVHNAIARIHRRQRTGGDAPDDFPVIMGNSFGGKRVIWKGIGRVKTQFGINQPINE